MNLGKHKSILSLIFPHPNLGSNSFQCPNPLQTLLSVTLFFLCMVAILCALTFTMVLICVFTSLVLPCSQRR
uniref:Uncharacterized protein n=1 Tax=Arundo donax TaxID=35708 RepID=A0A0A8Y5U2_ARUDO